MIFLDTFIEPRSSTSNNKQILQPLSINQPAAVNVVKLLPNNNTKALQPLPIINFTALPSNNSKDKISY